MIHVRTAAIRIVAATLSILGLAKPALADVIVADSVAQFSGTQGQGSWYYGYYTAPFSSNTFTLMTQFLPSIFGPGDA